LWYYRLLNNGGPLTWEQFVLLVTVRFGPQFTGKPHNTPALGGDVLFEATAEGDDALQADDSSDERGVGSNDVLAVGKGDDAVHVDDGSCALRLDIGSNTSSSGGGLDAHIPSGDLVVGGALDAGYCSTCSLDKGVLASGDGSLGGGNSGLGTYGEYVLAWTGGVLKRTHSGPSAHDGGDDLGVQGGSGLSVAADDALGGGGTLGSGGDVLGDGGGLLGEVTGNLQGSGGGCDWAANSGSGVLGVTGGGGIKIGRGTRHLSVGWRQAARHRSIHGAGTGPRRADSPSA
jgi:hypothetical protein